ncbi:hypothetical protein [Actinomadura sp. 7K507]|uniref:hypothetical protein n=1 Tax=Actinomadura sp. 7K507 TaxID=2530365 RepID=UPI001053A4BB|nr:hypothetical protein [Actinomadura sp. 7K507]TDC97626.1 hypothetical protein E1285_03020 [Actinomadura sp. 7K507]
MPAGEYLGAGPSREEPSWAVRNMEDRGTVQATTVQATTVHATTVHAGGGARRSRCRWPW